MHWDPNLPLGAPLSGTDTPGDIRLSWELGRHQYLQFFEEAWRGTGDNSWLEKGLELIMDWVKGNPFMKGVHWKDAQEVGLRLKTWLRFLQRALHQHSLTPSALESLAQSLTQHHAFLEEFSSRSPDTHNHLVTELCAQIHFHYVFPHSSSRKKVVQLQVQLLHEIDKQFWSDGSPGEGSVNYHLFVLESLLEVYLHASLSAPEFSLQLQRSMTPLARFAQAMIREDGSWPALGDTDSGIGSSLFVLLGSNNRLGTTQLLRVLFKEEDSLSIPGIYFEGLGMASCGSSNSSMRIHALVGPKSPRPGVHLSHHHADRLSFVLWKDGIEFLTDPATSSYNGGMAERARDRRTAAHNAPGIHGLDQMDVSSLRFGISDLPQSLQRSWQSNGAFAFLSGTLLLDPSTSVQRTFVWDSLRDILAIHDCWTIRSNSQRPETWFHLGLGATIHTLAPSGVTLRDTSRPEEQSGLALRFHSSLPFSLQQSEWSEDTALPRSVLSTQYGVTHPTLSVRVSWNEEKANHQLTTLICPESLVLEFQESESGLSIHSPGQSLFQIQNSGAVLGANNEKLFQP